MRTTVTLTRDRIFHQRRLRDAVKRLVIELGYLEHCLGQGLQDVHVQTAAAGIDTAIDCLNEHLAELSFSRIFRNNSQVSKSYKQ